MKKFILLALIFAVSFNAIADIGLINRSTTEDNTETLVAGSLEKNWIYVKNNSGDTASEGAIVIIDTSSDDGYTVTTTITASSKPHCMIDESCSNGKMCKCQTYGYTDKLLFEADNAAGTAGEYVYISETWLGYAQVFDSDSPVAFTDIPIGQMYDAVSSSADIEVFLKLR